MTSLMPRVTTDVVLDMAAGLILAHGHYVDHDFWPGAFDQPWRHGLPLDVVAAVCVARGDTTYNEVIARMAGPAGESWPRLDDALHALLGHLGYAGRTDDDLSRFWAWEDTLSGVEIAAVMRECAARLRVVAA